MNITDLGGHSGCRILLCETGNNDVFVRKISGNIDYNARLKLQTEKQKSYQSGLIKVPKILGRGTTEDGLYYFDMEYISGITMAEYMKTIEVGKIRNLVEAIVKDVVSVSESDTLVDEDIFIDKIVSLKRKLSSKRNSIIDEALKMLENHSWTSFPRSHCHGDLTLENIIVRDNQLYLIDFLDSFYDSWILDISSLMQDIQTLWSYRFEEVSVNTLIRLIVFRNILLDAVNEISPNICAEVYYALLLKLIRIYPYIKDEHTYNFLNEKTKAVINMIKQGKTV